MTLRHVRRFGKGDGRDENSSSHESQKRVDQRAKITKWLYHIGRDWSDPGLEKFRVMGGVCQPYPVTGERCKENLAARSALIR